ncbi:hypothetical protein [Mucilaginibacter sp. SG564]|uniref:hypothetical protein n=1 Tax=unclassified Mucilaginibacter TaxID=2617802 RepID=UPI0015568C19|nr:hypothetical protein [Mucilaginibacter sp. SG564]NOW94882.1 hypothetical protein [Mucilaginibacter sp. SG564]
MTKKILIISSCLFFISLIQACKKDINQNQNPPTSIVTENSATSKSQITFAKILAKAVKTDGALRAFLKEESLKQFDNDYDVLYLMIKDKKVNNTETVHEKLVHFANSKEELESIEIQLPLLTILIPTLPNFSPEKWNTNTEIPLVASAVSGQDQTSIYDDLGKEIIAKSNEIPGFPVLVVKQNERIVINTNSNSNLRANTTASTGTTSLVAYTSGNLNLSFADAAFDNIHKKVTSNRLNINRTTDANGIDPINIAAYNSGNDWQRDYIYYGLTATNTRGEFRHNYSEFITSFKFLTPDALGKIADQDEDPKANAKYNQFGLTNNGVPYPKKPWTDGNFEFTITILLNSKNGIGNQITKILSVRPEELFDLKYSGSGKVFEFYILQSVTPKEYHPNVELVPWDLQNYGTAWKFIVYENDNSQEVNQSYENTTTFAANFEITSSVIEKVGLKFGATATTSDKRTFSVKTTLTSDFLGEATLTFDQPIITGFSNNAYSTREITTGNILSLGIEPKRVF